MSLDDKDCRRWQPSTRSPSPSCTDLLWTSTTHIYYLYYNNQTVWFSVCVPSVKWDTQATIAQSAIVRPRSRKVRYTIMQSAIGRRAIVVRYYYHYCFLNNSVKKLILVISGTQNPTSESNKSSCRCTLINLKVTFHKYVSYNISAKSEQVLRAWNQVYFFTDQW